MKPVAVYNFGLDKPRLLKENRNRAAVYRLVNNCNNKTYIGSTISCANRFYKYYNLKHLGLRPRPVRPRAGRKAEAATFIGVSRPALRKYIDSNKLIKGGRKLIL